MIKKLIEKVKKSMIHDYELKKLIKGGAKIGKNLYYQGSYIDPGFPFLIEIGDDVTLSCVALLAHDGSTQKVCKKSRVGKVIIGNNVFIGYHSIVLPNVRIGNNVIIGAGSIVSKDIPDNSVAVGSPCRVIGTFEDYQKKHLEFMKTHPVYPTYHSFKSQEEIQQMQQELVGTWGYDE